MAALYRAADIMVVTPYRDGMNLVAKEYVACRYDDDGALVLSEFAGAADELRQAWLVNPYDINGMKAALLEAYAADEKDLTRRMRAMRKTVKSADVAAWAGVPRGAGRRPARARQDAAPRRPVLTMVSVSTDDALLDVERIHRWLSEDAYWARGRSRETVERSLRHSVNVGAYDDGGSSSSCAWSPTVRRSPGCATSTSTRPLAAAGSASS